MFPAGLTGQVGVRFGGGKVPSTWPFVYLIEPDSLAATLYPQLKQGMEIISVNGELVGNKVFKDLRGQFIQRPLRVVFKTVQ